MKRKMSPLHPDFKRQRIHWSDWLIAALALYGVISLLHCTDNRKEGVSYTTNILYPVPGDNWPQIQQAVDGGGPVVLGPGVFHISRPIIFAKIENGVYKQVTPQMRGAINAKNCPDGLVTMIVKDFADGPAIGVQLAKGGYIRDLKIVGQYTKSLTFNAIQIDTLSDVEWDQPGVRNNVSSPDCGIAVDFASDSAYYTGPYEMYPALHQYSIHGMSRGGSTAVTFDGLAIQKNYVGFIITPSNQQNGEIINLYHSEIEYCKAAYAMCQAQSKQCEVRDFKCWGATRVVFDNVSYGFRHGDGANTPIIDGANIAGVTYEPFALNNYTFGGSYTNVIAEGIFKFGSIGGNAGAMMMSSKFDFQNASRGIPSPDYYMWISNSIFQNCMFRRYASDPIGLRITMDGKNTEFRGGQMNWPLICKPRYDQSWYPRMIGVASYITNTITSSNDYDSLLWLTITTLHVNKSDFSGYFTRGRATDQRGDFSGAKRGMQVIEYKLSHDKVFMQYDYNIGTIDAISNDTVYLRNVGIGLNDGEQIVPQIMTIKPGWGY